MWERTHTRHAKPLKARVLWWHPRPLLSRLQRLRYAPGMTLVTDHWPTGLRGQTCHAKLLEKHPKNAVVRQYRCHNQDAEQGGKGVFLQREPYEDSDRGLCASSGCKADPSDAHLGESGGTSSRWRDAGLVGGRAGHGLEASRGNGVSVA